MFRSDAADVAVVVVADVSVVVDVAVGVDVAAVDVDCSNVFPSQFTTMPNLEYKLV